MGDESVNWYMKIVVHQLMGLGNWNFIGMIYANISSLLGMWSDLTGT